MRFCRALSALAALAALLEPHPARAVEIPAGFNLEAVVLDPFDTNPSGFAFLPDGRILLLEKNTGTVRLAVPNNVTSVPILTIPVVPFTFEQGLVGVAVDPDWPARPYVYFDVTQNGSVIQVLRYTASGQLTNPSSFALSLSNRYIVLGDIPDTQGIHQGGTLRFGPDGYLYVSVGEDGEPCAAQNLSRLQGKILRIDVALLPSSGTGPPPKSVIGPPSNPYPDQDDNAALVYAYGLRNPFRFTIDPVTNDLFLGDVGQDHWEEIDRIPFNAAGANYGWPELEGSAIDPVPEADSCSTGPFAAPIFTYPHGPLGASVICGPIVRPVVGGTYNFPVDYHGDLFLAEFYDGWIVRLKNGPTGWRVAPSVPGQPNLQQWLTGFGFVCDMQIGPDGALYIMKLANDLFPRGLYRIQHDGVVDAGPNASSLRTRSIPNPARVGHGFTVHFAPAVANRALLHIYDPAGRLVRTLQGTGRSGAIQWDGRTETGRVAPAGVYAYRLELGAKERTTGKVTLVR